MEESNEVQHEKKKGRRFKTPSQVQALEEFYNEHKYPTESMKEELADKLGLTEKQVSGWFCHRRLKDKRLLRDETYAAGRQDLSSGVIQDRGSGLRQDSCGSTKQADQKPADLREVESRRLCGEDHPTLELTYEQRRQYDISGMDGTSSEGNSDLQENSYPLSRDPLDVKTSQYVMPNRFIGKSRGRMGPSGYLKIKGQTENAAITAVKRQLGRHYREDGPLLGVDFDPLPPGAFESSNKHIVHEPYVVAEPFLPSSHDVPGPRKQPSLTNINPDPYAEAMKFRSLHGSIMDNHSFSHNSKQKSLVSPTHSNVHPFEKPSFDIDEYPALETVAYGSKVDYRSMHFLKGMTSKSVVNRLIRPLTGKTTGEQDKLRKHNYDDVKPKVLHRREHLECEPSNLLVSNRDSLDTVERVLSSSRIAEDEELYGERGAVREHHDPIRVKMRPTNDIRAGNRGKDEPLLLSYAKKTSFQEWPGSTKLAKGSATEMPASFSDDETAETSSSVD